jgi:hypothetical protein
MRALVESGVTYSKSRPSRPYFWARLVTVLTKMDLFAAEPTLEENHREPVQPPIDKLALTL